MGIAIGAWAVSATLLMFILRYAIQGARPALFSAGIILLIQTHIRPIIFFLGLDTPFPYGFFDATEWILMGQASMMVALWLFCVVTTYLVLASGPETRVRFFPVLNRAMPTPAKIAIVAIPLAAISLSATISLIDRFGGVGQMIYAAKVSKELKGAFALREIGNIAAILSFFGLLVSLRRSAADPVIWTKWSRLFVVAIVLLLANNFLWGNRYNIAILVLAFGFGWHVYIKRINFFMAIMISVGFVATLQGLKYLRLQLFDSANNVLVSNRSVQDFWLSISTSLHFNQYDAFMLALRDAGDTFAFRNGADFINGLLSWVPRALYPDKETFNVGGWFRQVYQPQIINGWPITVIGSWFVNFGYTGVVMGGVLSGLVIRHIDRVYAHMKTNAWAASIGPGIAFLMIDGGVNTGFPQKIILVILPLAVFSMWLRLGPARPQSAPQPNSA